MKSYQDLLDKKEPYFKILNDISDKFLKGLIHSKEFLAKRKELDEILYEINLEYDLLFPVSPCPECGYERKASLCEGICLNSGHCKEAPPLMGG
jgi:hypothetical protein